MISDSSIKALKYMREVLTEDLKYIGFIKHNLYEKI